jgi:ribosomal peptide maturation radical SAM protein 1
MPWAIFNRPSIQLGALKSYLREQAPEIDVAACHPFLGAAKEIGFDAYRIIAEDSWAGEALYCALLFPEMEEQAKNVFYRSLGRKSASRLPDFHLLCEKLDRQLDNWLQLNDFSATSLIGFSVCFGQLPATLLAAERLKKKYPQVSIVLGGSTCVSKIGSSLLQVFPAVDFVVAGEGEQPLLDLCRYLQGTADTPGPAILTRTKGQIHRQQLPALSPGAEVHDLNTLPVPDYDDYFDELKQSGLDFIPQLPLEFSRGCWWNKCAFCNLNLQWCGYRFKKSERMEREVALMVKKYRCLDLAFTDNALPPAEADRFFTAMQRGNQDIRFFAEIRSTDKPDRYASYRLGGLDSVQIGIEAFSNSLLQRMNKGITVMDNLAAMKYCAEAGIRLDGNLILEFPGSSEEEAEETLRVLEFALPFRPLTGAGFFLGHGSPVWNDPGKYGIRAVRHHPSNRKLYPAPILARLNLLIKEGTGDRSRQKTIWRPVRNKIRQWRAFHENRTSDLPALSYREGDDFIIIRQERPGQQTRQHRLTGTSGKIYLACRSPVSTKSLLRGFNSVTEKALTVFLEDLENKKLIFRDGDKCLALAVHRPAAMFSALQS